MSILPSTEASLILNTEPIVISKVHKRVAETDHPTLKKQKTSKISEVAREVVSNQPTPVKERITSMIDRRQKKGGPRLNIVEFTACVNKAQQELEKNLTEGLKEAMIGHRLEDEGKIDEALPHYKASIALGSPRGEAYLGIYRLNNVPENKDRREGFELIKSSALKGDALGQAYLGYCYLKGYGTLPSEKRAIQYCNLSIAQGEPQGTTFKNMCLEQFNKLGLKHPQFR